MEIKYDEIENKLTIDNIDYIFNVGSEMLFQKLHKDEKFKFMRGEKEILNARQGIQESFLNSDFDVLKYFMFVSQTKYSKSDFKGFEEYINNSIEGNPTKINELFINCFMLFGGYMAFMGFPIQVKMMLAIMLQKQISELYRIILTSPNSTLSIAKLKLEEILKASVI